MGVLEDNAIAQEQMRHAAAEIEAIRNLQGLGFMGYLMERSPEWA